MTRCGVASCSREASIFYELKSDDSLYGAMCEMHYRYLPEDLASRLSRIHEEEFKLNEVKRKI